MSKPPNVNKFSIFRTGQSGEIYPRKAVNWQITSLTNGPITVIVAAVIGDTRFPPNNIMKTLNLPPTVFVFAAVALCLFTVPAARAGSRVLWNDSQTNIVAGRTVDWPYSTQPTLIVFPRGVTHDGSRHEEIIAVATNGLKWTSRYGCVVASIHSAGTVDGLNERGLAVHMLYSKSCDYGPRNPAKPGLRAGLLAQYLLDNAASVDQALIVLSGIQPVMIQAHGHKFTIRMAMEDSYGDSAIVEFIQGKCVVHHGREFRILTNDPNYDDQLPWLKAQDFAHPSITMPIPGNVTAADHFQEAAYYLSLLPKPQNPREAVADILCLTCDLSVPAGVTYTNAGIYGTEYRTIVDLKGRHYYFQMASNPNLLSVNLSGLNLAPGADVLMLDPSDPGLVGNVTRRFQKVTPAPF